MHRNEILAKSGTNLKSIRKRPNSLVLTIFFLVFSISLKATAQDMPLFESDDVIQIRIEGPFNSLIKTAPRSMDPYPAMVYLIDADGSEQAFTVDINARGITRRNPQVCKFPPLRVDFKKSEVPETLFNNQNRIKLVTHCQSSTRFQQYYFKEYLAYKAMNILTPLSFRVRLAEITYIDTDGRKKPITRYGFFIEDVDDVAERNGLVEMEIPKINSSRLVPEVAAIYGLFQYMIGNLDWSNLRGPDPDECCHNTKLAGQEDNADGPISLIAYDFDYSGLVNAPYAVPPENLRVRNVTTRLYRGFCRHNDFLADAVAVFQAAEGDIIGLFEDMSLLTSKDRSKAIRFINGFYKILGDPKKFDRSIVSKCRGKKS